MTASKLQNKTCEHKDIWYALSFKVSSINVHLHIFSFECGHKVSKPVDGHNSEIDSWDNSELEYTI